jgi:1,4-alpha-glucan branching enzyme
MSAKNKSKTSGKGREEQCVSLQFACRDAQQVFIAGSFNEWRPSTTPMIRRSDGKWAGELKLAPGRYEYRFVVDGEWTDDPAATDLIPNPFGGANAVLVVTTAP